MPRFTDYIRGTATKGWHAYSSHRQAVAEAHARGQSQRPQDEEKPVTPPDALFTLADLESDSLSRDERIKSAFSQLVGLAGPFIIACILSLANGYFFAGFKDFSWTTQTALAYAGGAVLELIGLAAIFKAQAALKEGSRAFFWTAFLFALSLAGISLIAQYLYLQVQEMNGLLTVPDGAIARIPIVNWLIGINGMQGHDWLFLIRGGAFHLAEIGCTFLISKKHKSLKRLIAQQREVQEARLTWERNELIMQMERGIAAQMHTMMNQQQLITEYNFTRIVDAMKHPQSQQGADTDPLALPALNGNGKGKK